MDSIRKRYMPSPPEYDCEYYYNLLKIQAGTAKLIADARWDFVKEINAKTVLDYGSGCGFFKAFASPSVKVDTFDIMPVPTTGITRKEYDLITFWDVLEHLSDLKILIPIFKMTQSVAITVPIKPDGLEWGQYKHFKIFEHIRHFTYESIKAYMEVFNFELIKHGTPECPPRDMIHSFLFKHKGFSEEWESSLFADHSSELIGEVAV